MRKAILYKGLLTTALTALAVTPAWAQPGTQPTPDTATTPAEEAQEDDGDVDSAQEGETILVTGSRIPRPDLTSSSPVAVATAAEISASGNIANVEVFLNELPQFFPSTDRASNNPGNGLATIDLRGAGPTRTLVLVNGRRFIPSSLTGLVDLNNIPTPLVSRVDVVTGGASAVYGSDALAGVVNFILKDDFEGVELNAQYNLTDRGDAAVFTTSVTAGSNFADGRGNAAVFLGYTDRDPLFASARLYSRFALIDSVPNAAGTAGGCIPGTLNRFQAGQRAPAGAGIPRVTCFVPGGSPGIPATNFTDLGLTVDQNGRPRTFVDPDDLFNFAPFNYIQLPQERYQGTAILEYEISEMFRPFLRATYAYNLVPRELAPTPSSGTFQINLDNPFVTPELAQVLCSRLLDADPNTTGRQTPTPAQCNTFRANGTVVSTAISRRQLEVGSRQNPQETNSFQLLAGLEGNISDNWRYEAFYQYGRTTINARLLGDVSRTRFQQALLARNINGVPTCVTTSGSVVTNTATGGGCIPANIFGANNVSPQSAAFFDLSAQSQTSIREEVAGANVGGTLPIRLFATDPVGISVGVEYRSTGGAFEPDEALQFEVTGFNRTSPTRGGFNVREIFGEIDVPIIQDSFIHLLRATGAVRYSDYSTIGPVTTYAAGVELAPIRDVRFRGQYQKAIRAPSIGELFAGQGNNFPAATDVCSLAQPAAQREAVRAACVRSGVTNPFTFAGSNQVETLVGGNPDLTEEESDTYTAGVVISPRFIPGLNITADYFEITIQEAIATFGGGTANIINTCYGLLAGDPTSPFCQAIQRRPNPDGGLGGIQIVRGTNANIATLRLEGVDFALDYRTKLPFGVFGEEPAIAYIGRATYNLKAEQQADPLASLVDCVGKYAGVCATPFGDPVPEIYISNTLSMTLGSVGFTFQHRYIEGTRDARQFVFPNPTRNPPIEGSFTPIARPSSIIEDYNIFDASVNFDVNNNFEMTLGVENVFDRDPPIPGDAADEQNNTYPSRFDPLGRTFFVAGRVRF